MIKKFCLSLKKFYLSIIFLFLYAPILVLMIFSFNKGHSINRWQGFSFKWYFELFNDQIIMKSLYYTLMIAVTSTFLSLIIGTIASFSIFYMKPNFKKIILNINNLPILNPDIVTGVALMGFFVFIKRYFELEFGFMTLLISHMTFSIPFVILSVLPKLYQMPKNLWEAALDLGASPLKAFFNIIIPEIKTGIIVGGLIAFTMSIDDFVISYFTTGNGVSNLSITIFSMARRGISPKINALSTLMFLAILFMIFIINFKKRGKMKELEGLLNEKLY